MTNRLWAVLIAVTLIAGAPAFASASKIYTDPAIFLNLVELADGSPITFDAFQTRWTEAPAAVGGAIFQAYSGVDPAGYWEVPSDATYDFHSGSYYMSIQYWAGVDRSILATLPAGLNSFAADLMTINPAIGGAPGRALKVSLSTGETFDVQTTAGARAFFAVVSPVDLAWVRISSPYAQLGIDNAYLGVGSEPAPSETPEPASTALIGAGLIALSLRKFVRR